MGEPKIEKPASLCETGFKKDTIKKNASSDRFAAAVLVLFVDSV